MLIEVQIKKEFLNCVFKICRNVSVIIYPINYAEQKCKADLDVFITQFGC